MKDKFKVFEDIIEEMSLVYQHDKRPWMIGFSGGKDSTMLCCLVFEMLKRLPKEKRNKKVYVISSDTLVENPIVKNYMHKMSKMINENLAYLNVKSEIIYPDYKDTFWSKVIGLGYLTPEAPGFRWCTERLKIKPMNKYVFEKIEKNGEVILLLGVRKDESIYRSINITNREIEGKILTPHNSIKSTYVYNALANIPNELVWEYLLKDEAKTPWGSDNKYLFMLYQGEVLGEEKSVIGEIDKDKIPVTGNSRFGCWVCTMVKEDKSLKAFIDRGEKSLIPLRDFRNWLLTIRNNPTLREKKRRNGSIYLNNKGELGLGPFTFETRKLILTKLLELEKETGLDLITYGELKEIDNMWDKEGDLSCRTLVDLYYNIMREKLPWHDYKIPIFEKDVIDVIKDECKENDIEFELISKLIIAINENKHYTRSTALNKNFDKVLNEGWLHYKTIREGLENED